MLRSSLSLLSSTVSSTSRITAGGFDPKSPVCSSAAVHARSASARSSISDASRYACRAVARYSTDVRNQTTESGSAIFAGVAGGWRGGDRRGGRRGHRRRGAARAGGGDHEGQ